jgi:two-component system C4-dicarboxylate transport response regulator DctD
MTKLTILIVEDDEAVRSSLRLLLESKYEVVEAVDGLSAVNALTEWNVNLILSDYTMPFADGADLIQALTELNVKVPIVWLSGADDKDVREKAWKLGVYEFLQKPFSPAVLLETVQKAISGRASPDKMKRLRDQIAR